MYVKFITNTVFLCTFELTSWLQFRVIETGTGRAQKAQLKNSISWMKFIFSNNMYLILICIVKCKMYCNILIYNVIVNVFEIFL